MQQEKAKEIEIKKWQDAVEKLRGTMATSTSLPPSRIWWEADFAPPRLTKEEQREQLIQNIEKAFDELIEWDKKNNDE